MPPKRKLYVKPEALTKEKNSYRANRNSNIQRKIPRLEQFLEGPTRRRVSPEDEDDDFNMEYMPSRSEEELSSTGEDDLEDEVVGSAAEKRMKALGVKLIVPLGEMSGAFEGVNASTFEVELGSHIQRIAPYDKPTWSVVDDGTRETIYMAVSQKFDFGDWKTDQPVNVAVHKLAMHIYREFRSELHKKYKQLLGEGCDPKQYPPDPQRAAQWISMIEHKWKTPEWKNMTKRDARTDDPTNLTNTPERPELEAICTRLGRWAAVGLPEQSGELLDRILSRLVLDFIVLAVGS
ncbi:hypothetical protein MRB53_009973 [Persea americana]|uniref:Uncharacterized protein n=1 Tax=Persea americana TaxID=3435 RepID=A0ACC2LRP5_PERAE|nr:hypothetical protein MRB53_009973 [Persea americana]